MKTEQLIDLLARGVEPASRTPLMPRLALLLGAGLSVAVFLVAVGLGVRPDIGVALAPVLIKGAFAAACAAIVLPLGLQLMKPGRPLGWRVGALGVFAGLCLMAVIVALAGIAPEERLEAWTGGGFPWCIVLIPVLAAPTAALLIWLMRAFAPTRTSLAGATIGALSGGVGAMAYAMYCPVDSTAFVVTWYSVAIGVCAALGAVIGERLLRW